MYPLGNLILASYYALTMCRDTLIYFYNIHPSVIITTVCNAKAYGVQFIYDSQGSSTLRD